MSLKEAYRDYYNRQSVNYDQTTIVGKYEQYRNAQINKVIASLLPKEKNLKVLDAGCRTGENTVKLILENMDAPQITAIDFSDEMVKKTSAKFPKCTITRADLHFLPFVDESFYLILSREVFEHLLNRKKVLSELYRVLKTNGTLILTTPSWFGLICPFYFIKKILNKMEMIERWSSPFGLKDKLRRTGFAIEQFKGISPFLYHEILPDFLLPAVKWMDNIMLKTGFLKYFSRVIVIKALKK